ncbi:MAG: RNA polymerase factor sigma-54 [Fibrobacterota bacterium]|nr:RNA polymerase factor sigma-54 [Fibrobacterota bacterium]
MNFGLDLNLNVGLEQKLSPQMIQSLKLLQMNSLELEMVVKQELETNPLLETQEEGEEEQERSQLESGEEIQTPAEERAAEAQASENAGGVDVDMHPSPEQAELDRVNPDDPKDTKEIDWESYLEDGFDAGNKRSEELESPDERFEKIPVYSKTLQDHLLGQLQDRTLDREVSALVEYLVNSLDERGYLIPESKLLAGDDQEEEEAEEAKASARAAKSAAAAAEKAATNGNGNGNGNAANAASDYAKAEQAARSKASEAATANNANAAADAAESRAAQAASNPMVKEIQSIIDGSMRLDAASSTVREAFHVLQSMDPAGIGARNLRECLLLQIYRYGRVSPLAKRIVEEEFELLQRLKVAAIAKKFDVLPEQIQAAMKEIGSLEPHPGRLVSVTLANPITPDLIVEDVDGELVLMLNDRTVPSLKVSRAYAELLKKGSRASTDEKKYVREKLNSATWLIRAIEQRKSTMLKVMQAIIESQPDFFQLGPTHLRPLILQDVADKIGMHISTVSRVTNGKYVQTSHGIFELKYFFTAGVTQSDGREISSVTTKDEIKKLIESEDTKRPLSDQRIVEILKAKGLDVARRTVAKYRDQLEILPARHRKQY